MQAAGSKYNPDKKLIIKVIVDILQAIERAKKEFKITDEDIYIEKWYRK